MTKPPVTGDELRRRFTEGLQRADEKADVGGPYQAGYRNAVEDCFKEIEPFADALDAQAAELARLQGLNDLLKEMCTESTPPTPAGQALLTGALSACATYHRNSVDLMREDADREYHEDRADLMQQASDMVHDLSDELARLQEPVDDEVLEEVIAELGDPRGDGVRSEDDALRLESLPGRLRTHARQRVERIAELEAERVPEEWEQTEYVNGLIKVAVSGTSPGRGWRVLERGDRRGCYASQWFHLDADGEPFATPQEAIAAAQAGATEEGEP